VDRDPLETEADVIGEVAVVAVGEDALGLDADAEGADGEPLERHCRVAMVRELEVNEEILRPVAHYLDVVLSDPKLGADSFLDAAWVDVVAVPAQARHHCT
jgi:hypothetical protein